MTRVFVYESLMANPLVTGECLPSDSTAAKVSTSSLLSEGRAMLSAIVSDFAAIAGVEVTTLLAENREAEHFHAVCSTVVATQTHDSINAFERLAAAADWTLVIAPEIDGILVEKCRRVREVGGRLLGPDIDLIELLSDKHRTAECLAGHNVPVCRGIRLEADPLDRGRLAGFPFPAVVKPLDGCGSLGVRRVRNIDDVGKGDVPRRLEQYVPGFAASVAAICGPKVCQLLPPCAQRLSDDGTFQYLGGSVPIAPALSARATALARRAIEALPEPIGYIGVDMVLGNDVNGNDDVVIEINPRLTTSYVGLRRLANSNLAHVMLNAASGRQVDPLSFRSGRVEFDGCGNVHYFHDHNAPAPAAEPLAAL
jgi:predicted ATP-grasp superfamily ATP-dependent carboligase